MSDDISRLPPQVQERLLRYQQLQQSLQSVLVQKQQVELELTEIEQALTELKNMADDVVLYKSIGSLLVKSEKDKTVAGLAERNELLSTRTTVLGKHEERLRGQLKDLQTKIQQDLGPVSQAPP